MYFNLLSKVLRDISGSALSIDQLIDSIFPSFRQHIEPDLHHAQVHLGTISLCGGNGEYIYFYLFCFGGLFFSALSILHVRKNEQSGVFDSSNI